MTSEKFLKSKIIIVIDLCNIPFHKSRKKMETIKERILFQEYKQVKTKMNLFQAQWKL
uniref:Uncharacterized protein n=1 Tax=Rhizophora mucronata TaxID=61149 RepID=A0A2P2KHZ4_RHIMU